jgi:hypothetical protein
MPYSAITTKQINKEYGTWERIPYAASSGFVTFKNAE